MCLGTRWRFKWPTLSINSQILATVYSDGCPVVFIPEDTWHRFLQCLAIFVLITSYSFTSRVPLFGHEAKRKIRIFCVSCRSAMNFAGESLFAGPRRNSGSDCRSAFATTNSDGGIPGRMVRSQDPKESQTSLGAMTARYWSSPWATTAAWMKA